MKLEHNISNHHYSKIDKKTLNTNEEIAKYPHIGRELNKLQFLRDLPHALEKATTFDSQTENVEVLINQLTNISEVYFFFREIKTSVKTIEFLIFAGCI